MMKALVVSVFLSCVAASAWAQSQPAPTSAPASLKPAAKKPAPKGNATARRADPAENGACDLGVIAAAGNPIGWDKVGITLFDSDYAKVPSDAWGVDDVVFARVRVAAGPGVAVRRITYGNEALYELYEKPGKGLFNNPKENLTAAVRNIAANSHCGRYIAVTRSIGALGGTRHTLQGLGVVTQGPFGRPAVFAYIQVSVFDGPTFVIHDDPFGSLGARVSAAVAALAKDDQFHTVEGAEFPPSAEMAAKDARLRDAARALVTERLDRILPEYLKN